MAPHTQDSPASRWTTTGIVAAFVRRFDAVSGPWAGTTHVRCVRLVCIERARIPSHGGERSAHTIVTGNFGM
jgi:hypothetical protein